MFSDHKVSTKFSLKGKNGQRSKASTRGFRFQTTYISDHFKLDTRRLLVQCLALLTEYDKFRQVYFHYIQKVTDP